MGGLLHLHAQVAVNQQYADSLQNLLKQNPSPQDKIVILKSLCNLYWQQEEEPIYIKALIEQATNIDSIEVVYNAMIAMCYHYYNKGKESDMLYWRNTIDSLALSHSNTPNAVYAAGYLVCKFYSHRANYELAMDEAIRLLNKAKKNSQEYGIMRANEGLGLIFQSMGRDSNAVIAFQEGLKHLDKLETTPFFELQYLSEMILPLLRLSRLEEAEKLIKRYDNLLNKTHEEFENRELTFPIQWHNWFLNSYYTGLYIRKGELEKGRTYLDKATYYADQSDDEDIKYIYYRAQILYYQKVKNNKLTLEALDRALKIDSIPELMKTKVDLLRSEGKMQEAITLYDELLTMNKKTKKEAFDRQIQQLRTLNDLNGKELQEQELSYQHEQLHLKQELLKTAMFISFVLLIFLYILYRSYLRTQKLKDALLREKRSLVVSEKKLRTAKEEAENANHMKNAFIANISHEIRTPLNAIVGFSELLAEEEYKEEKKEFASVINKNSDLLMNLVNDVLDLSRLESENIQFQYKAIDIIASCKNLLLELKDKPAPNVELTFTSSSEAYVLQTDAFRLRQLVAKLLTNAAKFTTKGEINLSCEINEAEKKVYFIVTDTGCGIKPENQLRVFERFEKLNDFVQGTGLGLPICRLIAEKFGGSLSLDPTYTNGTRFIFIHPLVTNS